MPLASPLDHSRSCGDDTCRSVNHLLLDKMSTVKHELPKSKWSYRQDPSKQMANMDMWEINHGTDTEVVAERVYGEEAAKLIAAAPDMLKALEECLALFDMVTALDDHGSNALGQAENLIRTAIAKATK